MTDAGKGPPVDPLRVLRAAGFHKSADEIDDVIAGLCSRVHELREALGELAVAEEGYRRMHDCEGRHNILTGRAWDVMRRAGDRARKLLAESREGGR